MVGFVRTAGLGLALLLGCLAVAPRLAAQPTGPCADTLRSAQSHYVSQDFEAAESLIRACLTRSDVASETRVELWRLLTLVHLRRAELAEARSTVLRLLGESPSYTADPVQDPPAYVTLVGLVREQLGIDRVPEPADSVEVELPADPVTPPAVAAPLQPPPATAFRAPGVLSFRVAFGAGSYGGERGVDESPVFREFTANDGVSFALGASYRLASELAVAVTYRAARFPWLLENDVRAEDVQVRPDESSAWVHLLVLTTQRTFGRDWRAAPFVHVGVTGSLGRLNDAFRVGVGPLAGAGVDVALTPELGAFAELSATVIVPGNAVDRVDYSGALGDVLSFVGLGLRYRVAER